MTVKTAFTVRVNSVLCPCRVTLPQCQVRSLCLISLDTLTSTLQHEKHNIVKIVLLIHFYQQDGFLTNHILITESRISFGFLNAFQFAQEARSARSGSSASGLLACLEADLGAATGARGSALGVSGSLSTGPIFMSCSSSSFCSSSSSSSPRLSSSARRSSSS